MINGLYIINANTFWFMCYKVIGNITTISSNIRNKNLITNIRGQRKFLVGNF